MIKHLALLCFLATPFLAPAQVLQDEAATAAATATQPLVTYDITATFPANAPTTKMTAPNAAFYLEFSVPQAIPANPLSEPSGYGCPVSCVTFVFEGQVYRPGGYYSRADSAGNVESLGFTTRVGAISLTTVPGYHTPYLSGRLRDPQTSAVVARFATGDLGVGTSWYFYFTPKGATSPYFVPISLTDVVGRLVVPQSRPLATR